MSDAELKRDLVLADLVRDLADAQEASKNNLLPSSVLSCTWKRLDRQRI